MKRLAVLSALLFVAGTATADVTRFQLSGTVLDATGAVLPGATVTLRNVDTGLVQTAVSDERGEYHFPPLNPAGRWNLSAELGGFKTVTRSGSTFTANTTPKVDFRLELSSVAEEVTVDATAPVLETTTSDLKQSVGAEQVATLPNDGRSFLSFLQLSGSVVPTGGGSGNLSINGQGTRMADFLSDGTSMTGREIRTLNGEFGGGNGLSLDTIEEVQVISNGFKAEVGRTGAGAISLVTKSGTNEFHGSAYTYQKPSSLVSVDQVTGSESGIDRKQYGGTLSGPIVKDRTHFFLNGEIGRIKDSAVVSSVLDPGTFEVPIDTDQVFAKIDHSVNPKNRLDLRINWNKNDSLNNGIGGLNTFDRRFNAEGRTLNAATSLTSTIGGSQINEFRFRFTKDTVDFYSPLVSATGAESRDPDFSQLPSPAISRPGVGNAGPNPSFPQNLVEKRYQFVDHFSIYKGHHTFKLGVDLLASDRFVTFFNNFTGTYSFAAGTPFPYDPNNPATDPFQYTQNFGVSSLNFNDQMLSFFVQDDWEVSPGFTLNLGIRHDYDSLFQGDWNNLGPRAGFAWDIGHKGRTVVRGAFGVFYDTLESSLVNRESNFGPEGQISIDLRQGDPLFPTFPNRFSTLPGGASAVPRAVAYIPIFTGDQFPHSIGDRLQRDTPYFLNYNLGIEHQLKPGWSVSADVTRVEGKDLLVTFDANAPDFFALGPGQTRTQAQANASRPFGSPNVVPGPFGIDFGGFRTLYLQFNGGNTSYWGVKLGLDKYFDGKYGFQVRYTWSRARGDVDNFRTSGSFIPGLTTIDGDRSYQYGVTNTDVPHLFVANTIVELPLQFRFTGSFFARSGFPYTGVAGFDADGDGFSSGGSYGDRAAGLERNSFRMDAFVNVDLSLTKYFTFGAKQRVDLRFEVFNVFNRANDLNVNNTLGLDPSNPNPGFGSQTQHSPPRSAQFAVRYSF
jgi:outer membrane receptor protein involved in Fe transport